MGYFVEQVVGNFRNEVGIVETEGFWEEGYVGLEKEEMWRVVEAAIAMGFCGETETHTGM